MSFHVLTGKGSRSCRSKLLPGLVLVAAFLLFPWPAHAELQRVMVYTGGSETMTRNWQASVRAEMLRLLKLEDLVTARAGIALEPEPVKEETKEGYTLRELRLESTPGRAINAVLAMPPGAGPFPAVVAIHGHGGSRNTPFDPEQAGLYKCFGDALARSGYVVISTDVGQHEVFESGRTLMGERLWDLTRCVDYLETLPEVDHSRIGCAGLSLGGEMAMWLGAMDERIQATVSCGFLTMMNQMEHNHCMCWKFEGLREYVDFPDIYALIAPRALQCQNGEKEPETQFTVALAREALRGITPIYENFKVTDRVVLHVHGGGHEIDLPALTAFLDKYLKTR